MEFDVIMWGRWLIESGMMMVYQVISFGDNANGQILLHPYTKKPHGVTKDRPKTV